MRKIAAHRLGLWGLALALAGCATAQPQTEAPRAALAGEATDMPLLETLPPQELPAGSCGLFLWSKEAQPRLVFFSGGDGAGLIRLSGRDVKLLRAAGEFGDGESSARTYGSASGDLMVHLNTPERTLLQNGALVKQASISVRRVADGWEFIAPVGGLVACR